MNLLHHVLNRAELSEVNARYERVYGTDVFRHEPFFQHVSFNSVSRLDSFDQSKAFGFLLRRVTVRLGELAGRCWPGMGQNEKELWQFLADLFAGETEIMTPDGTVHLVPPELAALVKF